MGTDTSPYNHGLTQKHPPSPPPPKAKTAVLPGRNHTLTSYNINAYQVGYPAWKPETDFRSPFLPVSLSPKFLGPVALLVSQHTNTLTLSVSVIP